MRIEEELFNLVQYIKRSQRLIISIEISVENFEGVILSIGSLLNDQFEVDKGSYYTSIVRPFYSLYQVRDFLLHRFTPYNYSLESEPF